jgi:hypothetical protein
MLCVIHAIVLNVQEKPNLNSLHKSSDKSVSGYDTQDTFLYLHRTDDVHTSCTHRDDRKAKMQSFVDSRSNMGIDRLLFLGLLQLPRQRLRRLGLLRKEGEEAGFGVEWMVGRGVGCVVGLVVPVG